MNISGRALKYGDNINTDIISPPAYMELSIKEAATDNGEARYTSPFLLPILPIKFLFVDEIQTSPSPIAPECIPKQAPQLDANTVAPASESVCKIPSFAHLSHTSLDAGEISNLTPSAIFLSFNISAANFKSLYLPPVQEPI